MLTGRTLARQIALVVIVGIGLCLAGVIPASAAVGDVTITGPSSPVPSGQAFTIKGTNNTAAAIDLFFYCPNGSIGDVFTVDPGSFSHDEAGVEGPQTCEVDDGNNVSLAYRRIPIAAPPTHLSYPSMSYATFYPIVRDGYRDSTTMTFMSDGLAKVNISVRNSAGQVVRTGSERYLDKWTWDGRTNNASTVPAGQYQISATADANTITRTVTVATKMAMVHKSIKRDGFESRSATRGKCYYRYGPSSGPDEFSITLDCRGGRYARATFNWKIPSNAKNLFWDWKAPRTYLDFCCQGRITNHESRPSKTSARAVFQVTGWRAFMIRWVSLDYDYRTRI